MDGILIQYEFNGDENLWKSTTDAFIKAIGDDPELKGKFNYSVFKTSEPTKRVHVGRWDSNQTLETLKSRAFFKSFTEAMQGLAGESLTSLRLEAANETH